MKKLLILLLATMIAVSIADTKHLGAQSNPQDNKTIAGTAAQLTWCSWAPPWNPMTFEGMHVYVDPSAHGPNDHCTFTWKPVRDHMVGAPTSVIIHAGQNGGGPGIGYGHISCALMLTEHTDVQNEQREVEGTWSNLFWDSTIPSGTLRTFNLHMPVLAPFSSGHTPTWDNTPISVRCDVGNDFIVWDIAWTENGND